MADSFKRAIFKAGNGKLTYIMKKSIETEIKKLIKNGTIVGTRHEYYEKMANWDISLYSDPLLVTTLKVYGPATIWYRNQLLLIWQSPKSRVTLDQVRVTSVLEVFLEHKYHADLTSSEPKIYHQTKFQIQHTVSNCLHCLNWRDFVYTVGYTRQETETGMCGTTTPKHKHDFPLRVLCNICSKCVCDGHFKYHRGWCRHHKPFYTVMRFRRRIPKDVLGIILSMAVSG